MIDKKIFNLACPIPLDQYPVIQLAHGGGGRLMNQLIERMFLSAFDGETKIARHDSAVCEFPKGRLAFTTDSFVVRPLFFPGGDIGDLAVNGTVNDLAMSGARPLYLSAGFILEEGLPMESLWRVVQSMKMAADKAKVKIITGDTKVVDRGKGDGIYINTSGVGVVEHSFKIEPSSIQVGDIVLVNGDLGRHGMAIMAVREGLEFESEITSDTAPLSDLVMALIKGGVEVHCLRDLTRGGLASALNEIAAASKKSILIDENNVPVREDVKAACEILGLDPMHVTNEGRLAAFIPKKDLEKTLKILRAHSQGKEACLIGEVNASDNSLVQIKSRIGVVRILDMPSGEQLPRIC